MRAVAVTAAGSPATWAVVELPDPSPGPGQVRVRVAAATVNPTDLAFAAGTYGDLPDPAVPGVDLAGTVDAVGEGSTWAVGARVVGFVSPMEPSGGAQAELVVVDDGQLAATPASLDDVHAAALPLNLLTASTALRLVALAPGQVLGVTGATGAVGGHLVEMASQAGLRVVVDAKEGDRALVERLGASVVVPRSDDPVAAYRAAVPGGVDALVDGAALSGKVIGAVRDGGTMVTLRYWKGPSERDVDLVVTSETGSTHDTERLRDLVARAGEGAYEARVAATMPLEAVDRAHEVLTEGGVRGRVVLTP